MSAFEFIRSLGKRPNVGIQRSNFSPKARRVSTNLSGEPQEFSTIYGSGRGGFPLGGGRGRCFGGGRGRKWGNRW